MLKTILFIAFAVFASAGQYQDIEVDDETAVENADFGVRALDEQSSSPYHIRLVKIDRAQQQVAGGINTKLDVIVSLTVCKKAEVKYEDIESCEFQDNVDTYRKCTLTVRSDAKVEFKLTGAQCHFATKDDLN